MKSLVGGTFGKYEVNRLLGKGGMGEVYEAFDTDKGRTVALKVLPDEYSDDDTFRTRFLRESHAAAVLQEPHVIPIHDWGEIDHTLYIDMRLVKGQTLHDFVQKGACLEPERAVDIIRQVAAALDAAHAQRLIHRDVKPQNIIVTPDDFAYLVDFGIAEAKGDTHLTVAGYQVGSFLYMAPERFGEQEATPAVDIYSLACVLYEALTGRPPFTGHHQQVIGAHLSSPPPRPSAANGNVPAALDEVIARGMAKHPDDRYGSAGALARAAKRALSADESASSSTGTVFAAHYVKAPKEHEHYRAQSSLPPTVFAPPPATTNEGDSSTKYLVPALIAIAAALLVVVIVLAVGVLGKSDPGAPSPTVAYPTSVYPTGQQTIYQTPTYPSAETTTPSTTRPVAVPTTAPTASAADPEQQLRQIVSSDRSFVYTHLADYWVPQLSSKRPGTPEGGLIWDNAMALNEHLQLRQKFGALLLWSGDWSTFSASNYWVTVVNAAYNDSKGALAWCRSHGFDRDHCIAKIVSVTHGVDGSTAYN